MQFQKVTDPKLLKALNEGVSPPAAKPTEAGPFQKVTDPDLLKVLNGESEAPSSAPAAPIEMLPGKDAGIKAANIVGYASDEDEAVRFLASKIYPQEPLVKAVKRFGMQDGEYYHKADDGNVYRALPAMDLTMRGVGARLASYVGPAIPLAAGAAGGIGASMTGWGIPAAGAAAGGAAAAGETARQYLGDYLMGAASTNNINEMSVIKEGGMAALGQGIGDMAGRFLTRNAVKDIAKYNPVATQTAYEDAAAAGVNLTPAEATGLPTLQAQQKRLGNITATSDQMAEFYRNRDGQVLQSWGGFLDNISQGGDAETVGILSRRAATDVLENMRQANLQAARPFYEQAFSEGDREIWSPGLERLTGSPTVIAAMRGAARIWKDQAIADGFGAMNPGALVEGGRLSFTNRSLPAFPNLQLWDYTKRILDDQTRKAVREGQNAKARTLTQLTQALRGELDTLAPGYREARAVYGTGADDVAGAMESALGILADTTDTNILSAAKHIFNPRTRSPNMVVRLRHHLETQDPNAWQALKRLYMQDVTVSALRSSEQGGAVLNPAGKLVKAFSDPRTQENLRAAMSPEEWGRMRQLLVVFRRASSVPGPRSDTEWNRLLNEQATNQARTLFARVARNLNPSQALRTFDEWRTNANIDRQAQTVVDLVTSGDPEAISAMKELRRLSPMDRRWLTLFGHMVSRSVGFGAGQFVPEPNYGPRQ